MIRALDARDLDAYRRIRAEALETEPDAFGETIEAFRARDGEDLRAWFEAHVAWPDRAILLATAAGEPRGMCGLYVRTVDPSGTADPPEGSFWGMFVSPRARRRGVGAGLLRRAVAHLAARGVERIGARVAAPNDEAAGFYRALGFTVGPRVGVLREGSHVPVRRVEARVRLRPLVEDDAHAFAGAFADVGWHKPPAVFRGYLEEQRTGGRWSRVATWNDALAGYVTVLWSSPDPTLGERGIPEVMDLNVLPAFRGRGLGAALLSAAEAEIAGRSSMSGLRVGLHAGYGAAQRLYVESGYRPDGAGAVRDGEVVPEGAAIHLDDDVTLRMTKDLRDRPPVPRWPRDARSGAGPSR